MSIKEQSPIKKAQTHSFALPKIGKIRSRYNSYHNTKRSSFERSTFLERVQPLTKNIQYEKMEQQFVNNEHKKLKDLLRQFNSETYQILGKYIDRPLDMTQKKVKNSSHSMIELKQKQIANSNSILEICQKELEKLEERAKSLESVSVQEYERKITQIGHEIEQMKMINKEIIKGNVLRGQEIKKDEIKNYHEVSDLELEIYILSLKQQRLAHFTKNVAEEDEALKSKTSEVDGKEKSLHEEYQKVVKQLQVEKDRKKLNAEVQEKKRAFKSIKQHDPHKKHQVNYFRSLKQLEETIKRCTKIDEQTKQKEILIEQSRKQLVEVDRRYKAIKGKEQVKVKKAG